MTDSVTRSGQITLHGFRMRLQVLKMVFTISFFVGFGYYIYALFKVFTFKQLYWILE